MYTRQISTTDIQLSKVFEPLRTYMPINLNDVRPWEEVDGKNESPSADGSEISRRESVVSRSLSEWNWSDTKSDERISPGSCSMNSSVFKVRTFPNKTKRQSPCKFFVSLHRTLVMTKANQQSTLRWV